MSSLSPVMPLNFDPLTSLVDAVAERQRQDFGHIVSHVKADGTLITSCDKWSDQALAEGLARLYPGDGLISEEGNQRVPDSEYYWVVDPLDGTTNFAAGIPYWAISIARFKAGRPILAIVDIPPLRQRIVAIEGEGVWRNNKKLQGPSKFYNSDACASLCSRSINILQRVPNQHFPGKIRSLGVASLNLISVAMGQTVAALEATPKIWDLAAAWLILIELGCPLKWLDIDPEALPQGTDLSSSDFPVVTASNETFFQSYLPWGEALVTNRVKQT
uniref:Inositol monophosphate family protein n=1 Tax=Paulinella chromatophora TaxID=39717 RepID=B1X454_PAUCH|nr:inositol monophosphate family protein [Paulinella chromatophora]ACB42723.1 inositol monophosphate family protein [Paulinella chromatophora]|eukprot:gb/GEZN01000787.1/.p1 GENE.gb/GEZN01000787.1/~~gb/GEZN01000787.1/.p1  ORF type:complete len:274 (+),score=5.50 gb/GEZN01000787.1/:158-979(+)